MPKQSSAAKLANSLIASSGGTDLYAPSGSNEAIISNIILFNSHSGDVTVKLYLIPTAGSVSITTQFVEKLIHTKQTALISMPMIMTVGDTLHAVADTNNVVSAHVNGSIVVTL